jgi:hypothetical protein
LGGTFFPAFLAFDNPMAIACLRLVTFLPLRPDLSLPFFISLISVSTFLPAEGEYLRPDDFLEDDFLADDFFADELLFFLLLDFFFAAFLVAIDILLKIRCWADSSQLYGRCGQGVLDVGDET